MVGSLEFIGVSEETFLGLITFKNMVLAFLLICIFENFTKLQDPYFILSFSLELKSYLY